MIQNGKLSILRKTQGQWLVWCIFFLPFICPVLIEIFRIPSMIHYSMDVCWLLLFGLLLLNQRKLTYIQSFVYWVGGFAVYAIVMYFLNFQSVFYLLWGLRNNFRFYVFFLAVACFLRAEHREDYMRHLERLFWLNAGITAIQFFVLGYDGDYLGGLFGVQHGVNGYTNIFLVIYLAKTMLWYMNGKESAKGALIKALVCMISAAMAELKFYYVEAAMIIILCAVVTRFSWKKVLLILGSGITLVLGINVLLLYFPNSSYILRFESLLESAISARGYTSSGDLNRLNAISRITTELMDSPLEYIFGFGLGNCDTATYAFLNTPFFVKYESLHYTWLSTAMVYLEMGRVGLILFFGFYLLVFAKANKLRKQGGDNLLYCQLAMAVAAMCVAIGVYNSSLRTEAGYMMYFIMALPFVQNRSRTVSNTVQDKAYDEQQNRQ